MRVLSAQAKLFAKHLLNRCEKFANGINDGVELEESESNQSDNVSTANRADKNPRKQEASCIAAAADVFAITCTPD